MKSKIISYKRFWHELGKEMPLDENGFLRNPDSKWYHVYFDGNVHKTEGLADIECLILLGEPGIGKSTELKKLMSREAARKHKKASFILRRFESKNDFKESVLDDNTVSEWIKNSNEPLSLYLDGLDEALLEAKKISYGVVDVVRNLKKYGQVFLRITCRTSDLPKEFQNELSSLYAESSMIELELAPLRGEDAKLAANEYGLDGKKFFSTIYEKELGAMASRPITLNMLIQEYLESGKISESIEEVYKKGCLYLLDETEDRRKAGYESTLTKIQQLMVAERIAAVLILCNYSNLNIGSIKKLSKTELHVDKVDAGKEINSATGTGVEVTKQAINEVVNTSLFKPYGSDRYSLIHQTFAEYLTAKYLVRNQFEMSQLESILLHDDGVSKGIIPQLKEVSMWLALMYDDFFMKLIDVDPFLLLKSSIDIHEKKKLKLLIRSLIKKLSERNRAPDYLQYFKFLKNLEFDGIQTVLKKEISRPGSGTHTKKFVIDIVDAIGSQRLADDIIEIALDPKEELELRRYALEVLSDLENDPKKLEKLLSLLEDPAENKYRLISKAIKCLYPASVTSERLTEIFDYDVDLKDEILKSSGHHILEHLQNNDLIVLLDWASDNLPNKSFPSRDSADFFDKIILEGVKRINNKKIKKKLSRYILKKTQKHYKLFNATSSEKLYTEFLEYPEARRKIVEEIVSLFVDEIDVEFAYKLRRYRQSLVIDEDFDWILNHILNPKYEKEGKLWAKILSWSFNHDNVEHINKILSNKNNELIYESFKHSLIPIDIHSEEGKKARKEYEEVWNKEKSKSDQNISPQKRIRARLKELDDGGDIDRFCHLDMLLSLEKESQYYNKHLDFNIEQYSGWISANDDLKEGILNYAMDFINEAVPADEDWINDFRSRSAYRALRLISIYRPNDYEEISDDTWKKWLKPFVYFELSNGINAGQCFLKVFYQKFRKKVIDFITALIRWENDKHDGSIFVTRNIDSILNKDLADSLYDLLDDDGLKPKAKEIIKEKLLEIGYNKVLEHVKSNLNRENEDEFARDAYLISKYSPDEFFEIFWSEFEVSSELSHKIIARIVSADRHKQKILKSLNEEQLANLYIWLERNYPAAKDPKMQGAVTTRMEISDFRRYTLNHLVARGTEEACNQMLAVVSALPDKKWLKATYEEAKDVYRRETWQPLEVEELLLATNQLEDPSSDEEIVELRPNFYGLGINLRAWWRKYFG